MDFDGVYRRLHPAIERMASRSARPGVNVDRDDLLQEMRLKLWQNLEGGRYLEKSDGFILRGLHFHLLNVLRKESTYRKRVWSSPSIDSNALLDGDGPEEIEARTLCGQILERCGSDKARRVLEMISEGRTLREIGDCLRISHVRVHQIRKRMAGLMAEPAHKN
jgi:RNA polymerase sigma factor (sigma-70 family)